MSEVQNEEDLKRAVLGRGKEYPCICKKTGNNQERERVQWLWCMLIKISRPFPAR